MQMISCCFHRQTKACKNLLMPHTNGTDNDIIFNGTKSQVMFFDTRKTGHVTSIRLGDYSIKCILVIM